MLKDEGGGELGIGKVLDQRAWGDFSVAWVFHL